MGQTGLTSPTCLTRQTLELVRRSMEIGETLYVTTPEEFRAWLEENHKSKKEIWLIQYKKATKKPSIDYIAAVEEARCFGWIDNTQKSMDAERYATRFSLRRPRSNWTETNKERARRLIAEGKMTEAGFATLPPDVKTFERTNDGLEYDELP